MTLRADHWGRPEIVTRGGTHYAIGEPGCDGDIETVDRYLAYAKDNRPEDVDELLDARLILQAEHIVTGDRT